MITLVIGIPNSGKTAYAEQFESVVHLDDFRGQTRSEQIAACAEYVRGLTGDAIVEGVFLTAAQRAPIAALPSDRKVCVFVDTPLEECIRRETRHRPEKMIRSYANMLERPSEAEGFDEVKIIADV